MPVVVVTGGSRGIGAASAVALARRGWDVCVGYRQNAEAAAAVVDSCRSEGRQGTAVQVDVGVEEQIVALFEVAARHLGPLGALINNAGIVAPRARLDEMDVARVQHTMLINVVGAFLCAREAVRRLSTAHGGRGGVIVNISSAAARLGSPGEYIDYAAAKAAIDIMTIGLAREVADEGVRVNAVRPGLIETEIHASGGQPDRLERLRDLVPMRRSGQPNEVAGAVAWLCSEEASYVTGAVVDVTGGR